MAGINISFEVTVDLEFYPVIQPINYVKIFIGFFKTSKIVHACENTKISVECRLAKTGGTAFYRR